MRRFANEVIAPKVRDMDEKEMMDPEIIKACFEQGVRMRHILSCLHVLTSMLAYGD